MVGWTDRQTDRQTDAQTYRQMNGWKMEEWTNGWRNERREGGMDRHMEEVPIPFTPSLLSLPLSLFSS